MQVNKTSRWRDDVISVTVGTITSCSAALLAVLAFVGTYVRPTSDDWCALWKTREMGVFGITEDFYLTQNGRIANAFVSGLLYLDGLTGMKVFPALLIVGLGGGLVVLLRQLWPLLGWESPLLVHVTLALLVELLLFMVARNPYQVLLWAPATISHTLPTVIGVWAVALAIRAGRSERRWVRVTSVVCAVLTGFFIGTLNEPFVVVAGLGTGLAGLLFLVARRWYALAWSAAAAAGMVIGYVVLYTSPGAAWRRSQSPPGESLLSGSSLSGAFGSWLDLLGYLSGQYLYLAAAAIGLAVGLLSTGDTVLSRRWAVGVLLAPLPVVLLGSYIIVLGLRQGYGPNGWEFSRTWFSFLAPMVLTLCLYGIAAGRALRDRSGSTVAVVLACALTLCGLVTLVPRVRSLTTETVTRAAAWDKQNTRITKRVREGATVVEYKPMPIGSLAEPFFIRTYEKDWVSACAAGWYRVDRLTKG